MYAQTANLACLLALMSIISETLTAGLSVLGMARRKSLCRASYLGMRATPAASQIEMVPLSVLVSAREDAKAHAAREAQLNDARFNEAKARLDEAKAHAAREAQLVKEQIESMERSNANKLSMAVFERDVAHGKVTARALIPDRGGHGRRLAGLGAPGRKGAGAGEPQPQRRLRDETPLHSD